jgi:DNA-binding MarR family transcriptional regulator
VTRYTLSDQVTTTSDMQEAVAHEVVQLVGDLVARTWEHYEARIAEFSLSVPEAKALLSMQADQPLVMRELAARIHASPSNVTLTVDRLAAQGLLARSNAEDRRVKCVLLTPKGVALRKRLEERLATDHPAVRGLSPSQQAALADLLRAIRA